MKSTLRQGSDVSLKESFMVCGFPGVGGFFVLRGLLCFFGWFCLFVCLNWEIKQAWPVLQTVKSTLGT